MVTDLPDGAEIGSLSRVTLRLARLASRDSANSLHRAEIMAEIYFCKRAEIYMSKFAHVRLSGTGHRPCRTIRFKYEKLENSDMYSMYSTQSRSHE